MAGRQLRPHGGPASRGRPKPAAHAHAILRPGPCARGLCVSEHSGTLRVLRPRCAACALQADMRSSTSIRLLHSIEATIAAWLRSDWRYPVRAPGRARLRLPRSKRIRRFCESSTRSTVRDRLALRRVQARNGPLTGLEINRALETAGENTTRRPCRGRDRARRSVQFDALDENRQRALFIHYPAALESRLGPVD